MSAFGVAAPCRLACAAAVLLRLAAGSDTAAGEVAAGGSLLRGTPTITPSGAAAGDGMQASGTLIPSLDDSQAFVEDGYTKSSGGADVAAAGTSSDLGSAMVSIGKGNSSSSSSGAAAQSQSAGSLAATLYQHSYLEGFYLGVYGDIASMSGEWNDKVSSLVIYPNWCITLFEHVSFAGSWRRMCAGSSTWKIAYIGNDWNDRVSSVKSAPRR